MTKQPLFSAMTTDFDADIKNFKEILNELELRTHTKNGYKFSLMPRWLQVGGFLRFTWSRNLQER